MIEADTAFNPSVTAPFGNQVVTTVVGTAGETITAPSRAFTLAGSVGTKLTINISPVIDPIRLNNVATIYRYVLYPGPTLGKVGSENALRDAIQFPGNVDGSGVVTVSKALLVYPQCILCLTAKGRASLQSKDVNPEMAKDPGNTEVNSHLGWGWLHSEAAPVEHPHTLGIHNGHMLSMPEEDYIAGHLRTLVLLVMQSPPPASNAPR